MTYNISLEYRMEHHVVFLSEILCLYGKNICNMKTIIWKRIERILHIFHMRQYYFLSALPIYSIPV